jgi:hypothetical protein
MRPLVAGLFALSIAATVLAGDGLVLVPHTHALGTPPDHPHGLALYRFPIALLGEPADAPRAAAEPSRSASFRMASAAAETLIGASLLISTVACFTFAVLCVLARARGELPAILRAQWSHPAPTGPPRPLPIV